MARLLVLAVVGLAAAPLPADYAAMLKASPISIVDKVTTPTLLHIGEGDLRVPPAQGREWFSALKAMEVDVQMLTYPDDTHGLVSPATEQECLVSIAEWMQRYMPE